jgi:hypothetical protein
MELNQKMWKRIRDSRVAAPLILIAISLLVSEFLAKGATYFFLGIKDASYAQYYGNDPKLILISWMDNYTPHPYFGYESSQIIDFEKILSERSADDFVIGILGGSVAQDFGFYSIRHPSHFEPLREAIPAFGRKNLRIVNLALGGFKQPQQFFIATYFMDNLDLVINIDGFNDALPTHLLPVYPLDYPLYPQFYGRTGHGGIYTTLGRTARWLYKNINRVALEIPGLSRSSLYFVCWYSIHDLLYQIVRASESAYYSNEFRAHQSESLRRAPAEEFIRKRIAIWKKYTILEDDLVRKRTGKPVFFFLQPNQYVKDSKPFSEKEKQIAIHPSLIEETNARMVLLRETAQALRRSDVPIFDLTSIFADTHETVYRDDCCHLNDLGNQIMADAVVSSVMLYQRGPIR